MKKSRKNILVFDHTKINQVKKAYIGDLNQFDLLAEFTIQVQQKKKYSSTRI